MTDVRALLRSERASRRIEHPHASYTGSGRLLCKLCNTQIKSESLWSQHLKSPLHIFRSQQTQEAPEATRSKKRKASVNEDDGRKRARAEDDSSEEAIQDVIDGPLELDTEQENDHKSKQNASDDQKDEEVPSTNGHATPRATKATMTSEQEKEEAEWAEIQFEIEAATREFAPSAVSAAATISAAPVTAEQLAAQAREDQSIQRGSRDAEIEAEKEDAERALEDEFEEMEGLEERVRKLREKREALRVKRAPEERPVSPDQPVTTSSGDVIGQGKLLGEEEEEEEEDSDDEDDDEWGFGPS